jgi:hypothetical protein
VTLFIAGLIIILLLTYKIVASCVLGLEVLQNNTHADGRSKMSEETRMYLRLDLEATITRRNLFGFCLQPAPRLSTVQLIESLLRDVVTGFGAVDDGNRNRLVGLQVCQVPARAAVLVVRFDVPCGADIWEVGEILEMRVTMVEIGASNALGVAVLVVVLVRPRDIVEDNGEDVLAVGGVGIRSGV